MDEELEATLLEFDAQQSELIKTIMLGDASLFDQLYCTTLPLSI
jgi:hypothetical protein